MSRKRSVGGHDRPFVGEHGRLRSAEVEHRLERKRHPGLDLEPAARCAVVWDVRGFVHLLADPMPDVLADDAETMRFRGCLHGVTDVAEALAHPRLAQPIPQGLFCGVYELLHLVGDVANRGGEGCVTVPPLVDRPGVDRNDVSVSQHIVPGDAVHDRPVRGGADRRREPVVPEERRSTAVVPHHFRADGVEGRSSHPRGDSRPDRIVHRSNTTPSDFHLGKVFRGLLGQDLGTGHQTSALTTPAKTSSTAPIPSTATTLSP